MDLNKLYQIAVKVPEYLQYVNKYTYLACTTAPEIRYGTLDTLLKYKNSVGDVPDYLIKMTNEVKEVLLIPNIINGYVTQIVARAVHDKQFQTLIALLSYPFGMGTMSPNRIYLDPVVVCEGVGDMYALRRVYPNVVATLTAGLTVVQIEMLRMLTNCVILAYDADESGQKAFYRDQKRLKDMDSSISVNLLKHPEGVKDPGEVLDMQLRFEDKKYEMALKSYESQIKSIQNSILR